MNRLFLLCGALALCAIIGASVQADDEKGPTTKAIMKKVHGKGGLASKVGTALKAKNFDDAATDTKEWFECAKALTKTSAKKGEAASYKKLTGGYCGTVKALTDAVEAKDAKKAQAALGKIGGQCKTCHTAHR